MCASTSLQPRNTGVPPSDPSMGQRVPGGPIRPPLKPMIAAYRRALRAANSSERQAPCENPNSAMPSADTCWASSSPSTRPTVSSAALNHGSFCLIGARNDIGYQVRPSASGATYATSSNPIAEAIPSTSSAAPPRPWMKITVKAAPRSGPTRVTSSKRPPMSSFSLTCSLFTPSET